MNTFAATRRAATVRGSGVGQPSWSGGAWSSVMLRMTAPSRSTAVTRCSKTTGMRCSASMSRKKSRYWASLKPRLRMPRAVPPTASPRPQSTWLRPPPVMPPSHRDGSITTTRAPSRVAATAAMMPLAVPP